MPMVLVTIFTCVLSTKTVNAGSIMISGKTA